MLRVDLQNEVIHRVNFNINTTTPEGELKRGIFLRLINGVLGSYGADSLCGGTRNTIRRMCFIPHFPAARHTERVRWNWKDSNFWEFRPQIVEGLKYERDRVRQRKNQTKCREDSESDETSGGNVFNVGDEVVLYHQKKVWHQAVLARLCDDGNHIVDWEGGDTNGYIESRQNIHLVVETQILNRHNIRK